MILSSSVLSTKIILFFLSYCLSPLVEDEGIVREEEGKMRENEERRVCFFFITPCPQQSMARLTV